MEWQWVAKQGSTRRRNFPSATLFTINPTRTDLGSVRKMYVIQSGAEITWHYRKHINGTSLVQYMQYSNCLPSAVAHSICPERLHMPSPTAACYGMKGLSIVTHPKRQVTFAPLCIHLHLYLPMHVTSTSLWLRHTYAICSNGHETALCFTGDCSFHLFEVLHCISPDRRKKPRPSYDKWWKAVRNMAHIPSWLCVCVCVCVCCYTY